MYSNRDKINLSHNFPNQIKIKHGTHSGLYSKTRLYSTYSYIQKSVLSAKLLRVSYPKAEGKRKYSTQVSFLDSNPSKPNLDKDSLSPGFITGFIDAEGCFSVWIEKSNHTKIGWRVRLFFDITLHKKDKVLLGRIKNYYVIGNVYDIADNKIQYRVSSIQELKVIIEHFNKYPLLSKKRADF